MFNIPASYLLIWHSKWFGSLKSIYHYRSCFKDGQRVRVPPQLYWNCILAFLIYQKSQNFKLNILGLLACMLSPTLCTVICFRLWKSPSSETELRLFFLQYCDLPPLINVEDRQNLSYVNKQLWHFDSIWHWKTNQGQKLLFLWSMGHVLLKPSGW